MTMSFCPKAQHFNIYDVHFDDSQLCCVDVKTRLHRHLEQLEHFLKQHILHVKDNRAEFRMQLCISISKLPVSDAAKLAKMQRFLVPDNHRVDCSFAKNLLGLIAAEQPQLLGLLVKEDTPLLRRFFQSLPMVQRWFDGFEKSARHGVAARGGAAALRQYLFVNRETEWDNIAWRQGVGYTPPTVAARPELLIQMDAVKTACRLLEDPKFVCSQPLQSAVAEGSIIALDPDFFIEALLDDLADQPALESRVLATILSYVRGCRFAHLLMALYPALSDQQLLQLLPGLLTGDQRRELTAASWESVVLVGCRWRDIDDLLLCHTLATTGLKEAVTDEALQPGLDAILQEYNPHQFKEDRENDLQSFNSLHSQLHKHRIEEAEVKFALLCSFRLFYCLRVHLHRDDSLATIVRRHRLPLQPVFSAVDVDLEDSEGDGDVQGDQQQRRAMQKQRRKDRKKRKKQRKKAKKERKRRKATGACSLSSSSSASSSSVCSEAREEELDPQDPLAELQKGGQGIAGWKVPEDGPPSRTRSLLRSMTGGLTVGTGAVPALLADLFKAEYLLALQRDAYDAGETAPRQQPGRRRSLRMDAEEGRERRTEEPPVSAGPREWDVGKEEQWSSGEEWDGCR